MRGLMSAMLGVEGVRRAQERYGKGKWMRWRAPALGLENLTLDQKKLDALGFAGVHAAYRDYVGGPHGRGLGAGADVGRRQVELHVRLAAGR